MTESEITITAGASMANFLSIMAHTDQASPVLVEQPVYEPMRNLPPLFGGRTVALPRLNGDGWKVTPPKLKKALEETNAKLVVISNPHNPSGVMMDAKEVSALVEVASNAGAKIILDEVYAEFHNWNPAELAEATREGFLIRLSSLTKVYGFGPLRIGWILSDEETTQKLHELTNYTYAVHGAINERIGHAVWQQRERFRDEATKRAAFNLDIMRKFLTTQERLSWEDPKAGILGFVRVSGLEDTTEFVAHLRTEDNVMVVPGHFFGLKDGFRVGLGNRPDQVRIALQRLGKRLQNF